MSSQRGNQPTGKAPILQIDSATFQAAVIAAVTADMVQLNVNKIGRSESGADNTNCSNNQGPHQVPTAEDTSDHKPMSKKRRFWNKKERNLSQKLAKIQ